MRLCHHCRKYNHGWPMRCRYCGAGLEGRLCPRNHVNPVDPSIAFCGECGQPLERTWGAGRSTKVYLLAILIFFLTFIVAILPIAFSKEAPMFSALLSLVVLVIGFRLAFGILPPGGRHLVVQGCKGIGRILSAALFGTGHKGRV